MNISLSCPNLQSGESTDPHSSKRFHKPKEFRPELANADFQLKKTKTQNMLDALGFEENDLGDLDKLDKLDALLSDSEDEDGEVDGDSALNMSASLTDEVERIKQELERTKYERDEVKREKEVCYEHNTCGNDLFIKRPTKQLTTLSSLCLGRMWKCKLPRWPIK